jgi:hypothetical protein
MAPVSAHDTTHRVTPLLVRARFSLSLVAALVATGHRGRHEKPCMCVRLAACARLVLVEIPDTRQVVLG